MSEITLAKTGKRYTHEEWHAMDINERDNLLSKYGPGYNDEAWIRHWAPKHKPRFKKKW